MSKSFALASLALFGAAALSPASAEAPAAAIDAAREAAAKYWSFDVALADGYEQLFDCTAHDEHGAMGVHYIHPGRAGDGRLELTEPDVLMYEPQSDGSMQLVGVEYILFEKDWSGDAPPEFLGRTLQRKAAVGDNPVDPFYEVHVWHWRHNPTGLFSDWNPHVSCDG